LSYKLGYNNNYGYLDGFHQQVIVPFIFSYYPDIKKNNFSFGIRNKIGYGITLYGRDKHFETNSFETKINYNSNPQEHEIYDNFSFIIKAGGKYVKFLTGVGLSFKYSFLNVPDCSINIDVISYDYYPKIDFQLLKIGDFNYASLGPSFDINLEIYSSKYNFSFIIGHPFEFLIPFKNIDKINVSSVINGNEMFLVPKIDKTGYLNFCFGIEFTFSFYKFFDLNIKATSKK